MGDTCSTLWHQVPEKSCFCCSTVHIKSSASICRNLASWGLSLNHSISQMGVTELGASRWERAKAQEREMFSQWLFSQTVSSSTLHQSCLFSAGMLTLKRGRKSTHPRITMEGDRRTTICAVSQDWSHSLAYTGMCVCGPKTHAFTASMSDLLGRLTMLCQNPKFWLRWSLYVLS